MIVLITFLIISIAIYTYLLILTIKDNKRNNIAVLVLSALLIFAYLINFIIKEENTFIISFLFTIFSVLMPVTTIILHNLELNLKEASILFLVEFSLFFNNSRFAKFIISKFLENKPHSYPLHKKLGDIYLNEGGVRKALNEYIVAINLKQDTYLYLEVAKIFYDLDNKDEAKEALNFILSKKPDFLEGHIFLSNIYIELEQYKEAARVLNDALFCHKEDVDYSIYYKLGEIYARVSDFKSSKEAFEKAYELKEDELIELYIAQLNLIENEEEKAINIFKELLYNDFLKPYVLYELAKVAIGKMENGKAISYINEAIRLDADLEKRAFEDYAFVNIKSEFIVSVHFDESEIKEIKEKLNKQKTDKKTYENILENLKSNKVKKASLLEKLKIVEKSGNELTKEEIEIIELFSETYSTIYHMGQVTSKEKTKQIVDRIFKQKLDQIEMEKIIIEEQAENRINEMNETSEEEVE